MKELSITIQIESFEYSEFIEYFDAIYSRHNISKNVLILSSIPLKIDSFVYNSFVSYYYLRNSKEYNFLKYYNI
jgi:hypothetical protein